LYIKAEKYNKDLIIYCLYYKLDLILILIIHFCTDCPNIFEHFTKKVYIQDSVAKAVYNNQQKKIQNTIKKQKKKTKKCKLLIIIQQNCQ